MVRFFSPLVSFVTDVLTSSLVKTLRLYCFGLNLPVPVYLIPVSVDYLYTSTAIPVRAHS